MAKLTLYHNPKCSTSNHALGVVQDAGVDADVVLYLVNAAEAPGSWRCEPSNLRGARLLNRSL